MCTWLLQGVCQWRSQCGGTMPGIDQQFRTVRLCQGSSSSSQSDFPLDQILRRISAQDDLDRSFAFSLIFSSRSLLESMPSFLTTEICIDYHLVARCITFKLAPPIAINFCTIQLLIPLLMQS